MSENKWSFVDDARESGYQQGYRHGVEDQKNAALWNLPEVRPNHLEEIMAYVLPWNWRTRRMCRRMGIKWLRVNGIFLDGEAMLHEVEDSAWGFVTNNAPDFLMIGKRSALVWDDVKLWQTAEPPAWMKEEEEQEREGR